MASALNEESVQKKLQSVTNAQDSIQSLSLWIIHHKTHHKEIVRLWLNVFKKAKAAHRLTLFYLCNDVVQNCKRKNAIVYRESFKDVIRAAAIFARDKMIKGKVERIFNIWKERSVFDGKYISSLHSIMGTESASHSSKRKTSSKQASLAVAAASVTPAATVSTPPVAPKPAIPQVDPKLIADFKPSVLLDRMRTFNLLEQEVVLRHRQMAHLKLDVSSQEAVKQLKDKTHGKEFSHQFEDSCVKLEEYLEKLDTQNLNRKALLELMETAQLFYDEQYREAKIVANAYKNFGTRITNMSKRVSDLKKSLPYTISPVPSPALDAPSPGQTPREDDNTEAVDMDLSEDDAASAVGIHAHTTTTKSILKPIASVTEITVKGGDSPPGTPEHQPVMAVYQPPSKKAMGDGLDKRLANLIPSLPMSHNSKKNLPESQDVFSHAAFAGTNKTLTPHNIQSFSAKNVFSGGSEGGSTPLSDERCSTPVQDEVPEVEPEDEQDSLLEQVKEAANPIDILTKLISKTQKSAPSASESNFLQSLSLLTSTVKSHVEKAKLAKMKKSEDSSDDEDGSQDESGLQPKSWAAWKAKSNPPEETSRTPPRPIPSIQSSRPEQQMPGLVSESEESIPDQGDLQESIPDPVPQQQSSMQVPQGPPIQVAQAPLGQGMHPGPVSAPGQVLPSGLPPGPVMPPGHPPGAVRLGHPGPGQPPTAALPSGHLQGPPPGHHQGPPQGHHQGHPHAPPPGLPHGPPHGHPPGHPQGLPPDQRPPLTLPPGIPMSQPPRPMPGHPMHPGMGGQPLAPPIAPPHQSNPPVSYMPPRLHIPPPHFSSPPPTSASYNPLMTPPPGYMLQTSPGQKENWPSSDSTQSSPSALVPLVGPDVHPINQRSSPAAEMPNPPFNSPLPKPPKGILRNSQAPVLKEVSQASGQLADLTSPTPGSGPKPPSIPPSPSDSRPPPLHGQSQLVLQPGEDLIEFTEKLKRKTAESQPEGRPIQPVFSLNPRRPNLTTITPFEEMDTDNGTETENKEENDTENSEENKSIQSIQSISTLGSVVRRVDHSDRDNGSHAELRRKPVEPLQHGGHSSHYESEYRDPYYDRHRSQQHHYPPQDPYRDPYSRYPPYYHNDPYGPSPPKRPYPDPYDRRRPYYRY
ncbi:arginine-glutamic acid dipeptide repeats protein-like isoform X1 [Haliotis rufescens]|uniref:arginine-glutamic acid dipeptide repeats protein-like isoform X1 n=1 Tax=Haliotis rufescens TaxID=6454 RepID=UPI00201FA487|nr:arginine-glutamic acid dipeptide repeats protein-like isoform X1 [Haliotis rufescens]